MSGQARLVVHVKKFSQRLDPETIALVLVGLLVVGLGTRHLARWAAAEWASGERVIPFVVVSVFALPVLASLAFLRGQKRFWYLGIALVTVGGACFLMAEFGLQLPTSWLE